MTAFSYCYCREIYKNQMANKIIVLCGICKANGVSSLNSNNQTNVTCKRNHTHNSLTCSWAEEAGDE